MIYSVWMQGKHIGNSRFELTETLLRRTGSYEPTLFGLTVLPELTVLFPALLDFAAMCQRRGLVLNEQWSDEAAETVNAFADTPEAQRVMEAAGRIAAIEVRDPDGVALEWDSLVISELKHIVPVAESGAGSRLIPHLRRDPVRYMIALTLSTAGAALDMARTVSSR
jgi:hypothetical protein